MKTRIGIPQIPLMEQTPTVKLLLAILEQQQEKIDRLADEIEILKEEIKRLKKHKGKPHIKPSQMDKDESEDKESSNPKKRAGSEKRHKNATLTIHEEKIISVENIPDGSRFKVIKTTDALDYMKKQKLPSEPLNLLQQTSAQNFSTKVMWEMHLEFLGIKNSRHRQVATEGALVGSILSQGFFVDLTIMSDDAGQFNIFKHILCWIHAEKELLFCSPEHPELPLHNNLSERDIREYVKKRKISGSTRSESGRRWVETHLLV